MTVRELMRGERLSIGRPCRVLQSARLGKVLTVLYVTTLKVPVHGTMRETRLAISTPRGVSTVIVETEWIG